MQRQQVFPAIRCETHHFSNGPAGVFLAAEVVTYCNQTVSPEVQQQLLREMGRTLAQPDFNSVVLFGSTLLPRQFMHHLRPEVVLRIQTGSPRPHTRYYQLSHPRHHAGLNNWLLCAFVTWFEVVEEYVAAAPLRQAGWQ